MNPPMQEAKDLHEAAKQADLEVKKTIDNGAELVIVTWFVPDWFKGIDWANDVIEFSFKDVE